MELRRRFGEADGEELYATFSHSARRGVAETDDVGRFADAVWSAGDGFVRTYGDLMTEFSDRADGNKQSVFVKDVIMVDNIEKRVFRSRSRVMLHRSDNLLGQPRDAIHSCVATCDFKIFRCLADRKLIVVGSGASILDDQGVDEMVEARPKVVDDLPSQDAEAWRDRRGGVAYEGVLAPVVLMQSNNIVRWGITERRRRSPG